MLRSRNASPASSAGFQEIHRQGFQPASLEAIVDGAGVTKGALYHHFATKQALGYAVVDEVIGTLLEEHWIDPIADATDPVDALVSLVRRAARTANVELGCPLNNLAQEMAGVDEGFQERIDRVYRRWEAGVAAALQRGQARGSVRRDVDLAPVATFVVSSIEGALGLVLPFANIMTYFRRRSGMVGGGGADTYAQGEPVSDRADPCRAEGTRSARATIYVFVPGSRPREDCPVRRAGRVE